MPCKRKVGPGKSKCKPSDSLEKGQLNFFKIILDTVIQEKRLMIPPKFVRKYGDELPAVATLSVANGHVWRVGLTKVKNNIFFHDGWHEFVEYYSIRHGYLLVFSYKGISDFHVFIFDMTACEINYPFNGSTSEQEPNDDKQNPVLNEDEMEDDDSIEILGFTTPLKKKVLNKSSRKRSMNKQYNPSSKQDCPQSTAFMDSSKNRNGYETGSKKCKMEEEVEIIDLNSVNESSQGKISKNEMSSSHWSSFEKTKGNNKHPNKTGAEVGSANKNTKPCEHELLSKYEDDIEIFVSEKFSSMYKKSSQESKRAIHAAKLIEPKNPSFMIILRPYSFRNSTLGVPTAFAKKYLSRDSEYLTLQDFDGREYPVQIRWRQTCGLFLTKGWDKFSKDNNLNEGDVCVFELIKANDVVLKVSIFHVSRE